GHEYLDPADPDSCDPAVGPAAARRHAVRPVPGGGLRAAAVRPLSLGGSEGPCRLRDRARVPVRPPCPQRLDRARTHGAAHPRRHSERGVLPAHGAPLTLRDEKEARTWCPRPSPPPSDSMTTSNCSTPPGGRANGSSASCRISRSRR